MKQKNRLLLLSGTPASGKDTITNLLTKINPRFCFFKKHRGSNTAKDDNTYIHVEESEFSTMVEQGFFLQHHKRYGRGYGVAKSELKRHWQCGEVPIIHVGKYENIAPLYQQEFCTVSILLMASLPVTKSRLEKRHPNNKEELNQRINAYLEERRELANLLLDGNNLLFDLIVSNSHNSPEKTAKIIAESYENLAG